MSPLPDRQSAWGYVMRQESCGAWRSIQPIGMTLDRWSGMDLAATVAESADRDGRYAFFTPLGRKLYDVRKTAEPVVGEDRAGDFYFTCHEAPDA